MKTASKNASLGLQFFDTKKDPVFIGISFVLAALFAIFGYYFAQQYFLRQTGQLYSVDNDIASSLAIHDEALKRLQSAEASVTALRENNIDPNGAEEKLLQLRALFAEGMYEEMLAVTESVYADSTMLRDTDESRYASYSAALVNLEIKFQDYKKQGVNVATVAADIATASAYLQEKNYSKVEESVGKTVQILDRLLAIKKEADRKAVASTGGGAPVAAQSSNGITYERKVVNTPRGGFTSDILQMDMNRTRVKTFTANENDCASNCPLKPLQSYVAENGGVAGINGTYFCPADYAQCASKVNAFDFLVFDYRTKKYLNSENNKFSVNPLMSFYKGSAHFYGQALGFGRDTGANGVISNYPALVVDGNVVAADSGKGTRCGLGYRGSTLWAVCSRNAGFGDFGYVFQALGATHAMNLDGGGSAALYFNGYRVGPGRQLPNAVVFTN